jgi:hypothetical protein
MDIFYPIIKIDEIFKPTHLQSNHLIFNVWPRSSQKLKLRINNNGSRNSHSQIATSLWVWWWAWQTHCASMGIRFFGHPSPGNIVATLL